MELSSPLIIVALGIGLDCLLGDPYWMPHPIRVYGHAIGFLEKRLNTGSPRARQWKGGLCWLLLVSLTLLFFYGLPLVFSGLSLSLVQGVFFYFALSNRCLIEEALKVERILHTGDLPAARQQLSMIVGRDTSQLDASKIRAATVETTSENLSDGVVAPIFFFCVGGIPLMMAYKMVNTLDSMIGYKNERYQHFGFFAAKLDDVANWVPARLTAFLMAISSGSWRALQFAHRYGRAHSSPNAGYPEAALAGILHCRLGGPSSYFGRLVEKPYIGEKARPLEHADILRSCWVNARCMMLITLLLFIYFI